LTTPEARAGLRQRLVEHSQAIPDPAHRRLYRDQWLNRFDADIAPQRQSRPFAKRPFRPGSRYVPPDPPVGDKARAIGAGGIDRATARALIVGFAYFPEALAAHCEQLAALPIADPRTARLRDHLVNAAFSRPALDRDGLATILEKAGAAADLSDARSTGGIGFSFTRGDADPERAVRDLGVAIEALSADGEIGAALAQATERLMAGEEQAFDEQRRLHVAREKVKERLASLTGTD
jgi:DNA primase